jgi:hypothetical protein
VVAGSGGHGPGGRDLGSFNGVGNARVGSRHVLGEENVALYTGCVSLGHLFLCDLSITASAQLPGRFPPDSDRKAARLQP